MNVGWQVRRIVVVHCDNSFSCEEVTFPIRSLNVNGAPRLIIVVYINAIYIHSENEWAAFK